MKKNRTMRVAVLMLALALVTCCFVGSTFAKYTSTAGGSDSVKVAKWEIGVTDTTTPEATSVDITGSNSITFDLFNTIKDTDDSAETDVKAGLIAPGTQGSFSYEIANLSEVNAKYSLTYAITNESNVPLQFRLSEDDEWTTNLASLNVSDQAIGMENGEAAVVVYWQWAYGDVADLKDDTDDTDLGILGQDEATRPVVEVSLTIDVYQVD